LVVQEQMAAMLPRITEDEENMCGSIVKEE
jgi:hypothetical protein